MKRLLNLVIILVATVTAWATGGKTAEVEGGTAAAQTA